MDTKTIKARFVGGDLHNQVMEVACRGQFKYRKKTHPIVEVMRTEAVTLTMEVEEYRLLQFRSEGGARYSQFVHESLISGDGLTLQGHHECRALNSLPEMPAGSYLKVQKKFLAILTNRTPPKRRKR